MKTIQCMRQPALTMMRIVVLAACGLPGLFASAQAAQGGASSKSADGGIAIDMDTLPDTYPYAQYFVHLTARQGTAPLHWRVMFGALPPGLRLEDDGELHGQPERAGDFDFSVSVTDSGVPQRTGHKTFRIAVKAAFTLEWKAKAHVDGNRIEGSAEVTNTTPDDLDLTFIVLAVAENGRATAIGYQHFMLPKATISKVLPFGDTLPPGGYDIHVDAVAEVEAKNLIYRHRLVSPGTLRVTVGP